MIRLSRQNVIWVLSVLLIAGLSIGLLFHVRAKEEEQGDSIRLQNQIVPHSHRNNGQSEDGDVQGKPAQVIKDVSDEPLDLPPLESKGTSSDDVTTVSEFSDSVFVGLVEEVTEDIKEGYRLQTAKTEDKLDKIRSAFDAAFAERGRETTHLRKLIAESDDEEEQLWIQNELLNRFESSPNPRVRQVCLVGIIIFREAAGKMYLQALSDPDRNVRRLAAHTASSFLGEEAIDVLFQTIKDDTGVYGEGRSVAREAIIAVGGIGGKRACEILDEIWNSEALSKGCRDVTLSALGAAGVSGSLNIFENTLRGSEGTLRESAVKGLEYLARKKEEDPERAQQAIDLLRSYIDDENVRVKSEVVYALGWVGERQDMYLLKPLLNNNYTTVLSYTEDGVVREKVVYPIRERAKEAIDRINARQAAGR